MFCSLLLDRLLALHVKLGCHLVAVVACKILIQSLVVTSDATANACSMGRKHGSNLRQAIVYIEQTETCHPLVSMIYHILAVVQEEVVKTLNHSCRSIREHGCFVVVAISMKTVYAIFLPKAGVYLVFVSIKRCEIDQDGNRIARHRPTSGLHTETLTGCLCLPLGEEAVVFYEIRA